MGGDKHNQIIREDNQMTKIFTLLLLAVVVAFSARQSCAQTTEFTYQGSLRDGAAPANANYDFEFALFDAVVAGNQIGVTIPKNNVPVTNGIFSAKLDFGSVFPGTDRYLEIRVRLAGQPGITILGPRQLVNSAPYSVKSLNADNATSASNAAQLGGVAASQYVVTSDPRMSDARPPTAGSANYVQNGISQQASSDFNISGTGTANILSAATQFNIGPNRVLAIGGSGGNPTDNTSIGVGAGSVSTGTVNTFVGGVAGASNTTGSQNSFFGAAAGQFNTTGNNNSFFGISAGRNSGTSSNNSFFGTNAGFATTGAGNSFFGSAVGAGNTTGSNNTLFGLVANVSSGNLTNASAFGARALVAQSNSLVLGSINGVNGATADTNVGIGTTAPSERLHIVGNGLFTGNMTINGTLTATLPSGSANYIQNQNAAAQASSNFNISGNGTAGGTFSGNIVSAATQYNIGALRVLGVSGSDNLFIGVGSGTNNTGTLNTFVGRDAGANNATGSNNSFFGRRTGFNNMSGSLNSFFGVNAGTNNQNGAQNSFFGSQAGVANTMGNGNSFFGLAAGDANVDGSSNSFFGANAGSVSSSGNRNTFIGNLAGSTNTTGNDNTAIGASANVATDDLSFATAIGAGATVSASNTVVLGRATDTVQAPGGLNAGAATIAADTFNAATQYNINGSRILSRPGASNLFAGSSAGRDNTTGGNNAFFGTNSGLFNSTGSSNTFMGRSAGNFNSTGSNNAFFGTDAGLNNQSGSSNTAIGANTEVGSGLTNVTAIGANAQVGTSNSLVLGSINGVNNATADTNVGIGTTTPSERLEVFGNGRFTGSLTLGSPEATNLTGKLSIFNFTGLNIVLRDTANDVEGFLGLNAGSGVFVGSSTSSNFGIRTNNTTRMTFDTAGNVGIGDSTPSDVLDVSGDIRVGTSGTNGCLKNNNGGTITGTCSSDIRFKKNVSYFSNVLGKVSQLRPAYYSWRADEFADRKFGTRREAGLIAQDVEKIMPELVTEDAEGYKQIDYSKLPLLTIQAVREQQEQIEALQKINALQQQQINELKAIVCSVKADADACKPREK